MKMSKIEAILPKNENISPSPRLFVSLYCKKKGKTRITMINSITKSPDKKKASL